MVASDGDTIVRLKFDKLVNYNGPMWSFQMDKALRTAEV
jgi:hypothetical protein